MVFCSKIVLTYCEKKIEAEGREFAKILRSQEQFIQTVNRLEKLEFKSEKIIGI